MKEFRWWRYIGIVLLGYFLSKTDFREIARHFSELSASSVFLCFGLHWFSSTAKGIKWHRMVKEANLPAPFVESLLVQANGVLWGTITPGRLGEFMKMHHLNKKYGLELTRALVLCLMDRFFDFLSLLLLIIFAGLAGHGWIEKFLPKSLILLIAAGSVLAIAIHKPLLKFVQSRFLSKNEKWKTFGLALLQDPLSISVPNWFLYSGLSLVTWIINAWTLYMMANDISILLSFNTTLALVSLAGFGALLPISMYGFGTREAIMIAAFATMGRSHDQAMSYSFLFILNLTIVTAATWCYTLVVKQFLRGDPHGSSSNFGKQNPSSRP